MLSGMAILWRHSGAQGKQGQPKYAAEESFIRALVKQIRLEVWQEEQWWWQPGHTPTSDERRAMALQRSPETQALSELYRLAAALVDDAIEQRDLGDEEPLYLPLLTYLPDDPVATERKYLAYLVMRGLAAVDPPSRLEDLREALLTARWSTRGRGPRLGARRRAGRPSDMTDADDRSTASLPVLGERFDDALMFAARNTVPSSVKAAASLTSVTCSASARSSSRMAAARTRRLPPFCMTSSRTRAVSGCSRRCALSSASRSRRSSSRAVTRP